MILASRGRPEEGTLLLRHALKIALDHELSISALRAMNNIGAFETQADRWESVIEFTTMGLELARRVGDRFWELSFLLGSLEELTYLGRRDEVEGTLEAMPPIEDLPEPLRLAVWSAVPMLVLRGDLERAREILGSLPTAATSDDVQTRMIAHRLEAMVLLAEGQPQGSLAAASKVIVDAQEGMGERSPEFKEGLIRAMEAASALRDEAKLEEILGRVESRRPGEITPYLRAQGARFAAHLAAMRSEDDVVEVSFTAAIAAFGDLSMPFQVALTKLELGEWLAAQGRRDDAAALLAEASEVFERLRARPSLERVEQPSSRSLRLRAGR